MAGGLMQILATGSADQWLTGNPSMSFFKQVYKHTTPFALESVRQTFMTAPTLLKNERSTYTCRIGRVGDLLKDVYLSFELPDIYSDATMRFQWIRHVAHHMIYSYSVRLDTVLIDEGYGEWLDIWTELSMPPGKRGAYDRMIGNIGAYTSPQALDPKVTCINNRLSYSYYPVSAGKPSIPRRRFYVPLPFWFTKSPALALPLVGLQYQTCDVTIELKSYEEIFQLWDAQAACYWSPATWRRKYPEQADKTDLNAFLGGLSAANGLDLNAYLECQYVFLGDDERRHVAYYPADMLIDRVARTDTKGLRGQTSLVDLTLNMPIKELIWITRRTDAYDRNELSNLTNHFPESEDYGILKTAKIMWNGLDRIEEKPSAYFNLLQPFQHHTNSAKQGIYCYSFALHPENMQPSGTFNASAVNKIQLYVTTVEPDDDSYEYELVAYGLYYNVFRVAHGSGSMLYAN